MHLGFKTLNQFRNSECITQDKKQTLDQLGYSSIMAFTWISMCELLVLLLVCCMGKSCKNYRLHSCYYRLQSTEHIKQVPWVVILHALWLVVIFAVFGNTFTVYPYFKCATTVTKPYTIVFADFSNLKLEIRKFKKVITNMFICKLHTFLTIMPIQSCSGPNII